jgi:Ca2+-binding EF-hand superfamily protein
MTISICVQDEIEEMFDRIDEDGDRTISFEEFAGLMLEMDRAQSRAALRVSFDALDVNRDGRMSFDEFRAWVSR